MKQLRFHSMFALLALLFAFGCENGSGEEGGTPTLELDRTEVSMEAAGGSVEINYTLQNPTQGGVILANNDADWITQINASIPGKVSFNVEPNISSKERSAKVTITYSAIETPCTVTVNQAGSTTAPFEFENIECEVESIMLDVIPADKNTPYICRIYTAEHIEAFYLHEDKYLFEYDLETIAYEADNAGQTLTNYLQNICHTGDKPFKEFNRLIADTDYVVYCYYIDIATKSLIGDIARKTIRTSKPESSNVELKMTLDVNGAIVTQHITPNNDEAYYYAGYQDVEQFYAYYGAEADLKEGLVRKWNQSVKNARDMGYTVASILEQEKDCLQGAQSIVRNELSANTLYAFYVFTVDTETAYASSEIILVEQSTESAVTSDAVIEIEIKNIYANSADVYWTSSDPNLRFARSVFSKSDYEALGSTDDERFEILKDKGLWEDVGVSDMNLATLEANTTYVAFAYGLEGRSRCTQIFTKEFTTKSGEVGMSDINITWSEHYDIEDLSNNYEAWESYIGYYGMAVLPTRISGVVDSDTVYIMCTTMPLDYYKHDSEWLREVTKSQYCVNLYESYNLVLEYEREYSIIAVAEDKNGNFGELFKAEVILYLSDAADYRSYVYVEDK